MISFKDTINVPKIIFPLISNKDQLRKILNVNQWDKFNRSLKYKLKLATEIFFNRYIYYHSKDILYYKEEIFISACRYGNTEIIQLMIGKGVSNWNLGLDCACRGGHLPIVQLMIDKGANNWDSGLLKACLGGNLSVV